jgi:hypothetical protein
MQLAALRATLDEILTEAAADLDRQAAARAAEVAEALEQHTPAAVQAAVSDALAQQRQWFADLINEQLSQMGRHSATATVLRHLRSTINRDDQ